MRQMFNYAFLFGMILFTLMIGVASPTAKSHAESSSIEKAARTTQTKQIIWWHNDELIKDAIVSTLILEKSRPDLSNTIEFAYHYSAATNLLLLFDSMNSKRSLETLASFSSYYFGEAPGENYSCLLLRKGNQIRPFLIKMLNSEANECLDRFKDKIKTSSHSENKYIKYICLSDEIYRANLKSTLELIEKKEPCIIEP